MSSDKNNLNHFLVIVAHVLKIVHSEEKKINMNIVDQDSRQELIPIVIFHFNYTWMDIGRLELELNERFWGPECSMKYGASGTLSKRL